MKKVSASSFFLICIIFGVALGSFWYRSTEKTSSQKPVLQKEKNPITTPTPDIPMHISIPAIHVDANIESVGLDKQGRMNVPQKEEDTAWFDLGFRPGQLGNAVIDGHLDQVTGAPAVFWNLKELSPGDSIVVTDAHDKTYTFIVTKEVAYPYDQVPLQEMFGSSTSAHLNLITCNGTWDRSNKNYSQRFVVYTDLQK